MRIHPPYAGTEYRMFGFLVWRTFFIFSKKIENHRFLNKFCEFNVLKVVNVLMYVGKSLEQSHSMACDVFTWVIVTSGNALNDFVSIVQSVDCVMVYISLSTGRRATRFWRKCIYTNAAMLISRLRSFSPAPGGPGAYVFFLIII